MDSENLCLRSEKQKHNAEMAELRDRMDGFDRSLTDVREAFDATVASLPKMIHHEVEKRLGSAETRCAQAEDAQASHRGGSTSTDIGMDAATPTEARTSHQHDGVDEDVRTRSPSSSPSTIAERLDEDVSEACQEDCADEGERLVGPLLRQSTSHEELEKANQMLKLAVKQIKAETSKRFASMELRLLGMQAVGREVKHNLRQAQEEIKSDIDARLDAERNALTASIESRW